MKESFKEFETKIRSKYPTETQNFSKVWYDRDLPRDVFTKYKDYIQELCLDDLDGVIKEASSVSRAGNPDYTVDDLLNKIKNFEDPNRINKDVKHATIKTDDFFLIRSEFEGPAKESFVTLLFYNDESVIKNFLTENDSELPYGIYQLKNTAEGMVLTPVDNFSSEGKPVLKEGLLGTIKNEIETFFEKRSFYENNGIPYKRGFLLYGEPGNGKTMTIKHIIQNIKDCYVVLFNCKDDFDDDIGQILTNYLGDNNKILVFEDIDSLPTYNRSKFLNMLDGVIGFDNFVALATTNRIHDVDEGIVDRPSRFDKVMHIKNPDHIQRIGLLKRYFTELSDEEADYLSSKSEGFSAAYFKEIFLNAKINELTVEESIESIKTNIKEYKSYGDESSGFMYC